MSNCIPDLQLAASLGQGDRKALVDHDVLACGKCHAGQRELAVVGGGNDGEVDRAAGEDSRRCRFTCDVRPAGLHFCRRVPPACLLKGFPVPPSPE